MRRCAVIWLSLGVVLLFVLVGALFVAAEIALVTLREGQVRGLRESGRRGRRVADLVRDPNRFLAAVQIGVTTAALLASAFGEATLAEPAGHVLESAGLGHRSASILAFVGVVLVISYVTIVLGELVPKRIGLQRPERTALFFGPPLDRVARISRPVIWFLSKSTNGMVRLLGLDPNRSREAITEEELRDLVAAHESLSTDERKLIDEVFAAGERQVREVMVPRTEVDFLDAGLPVVKAAAIAAGSSHSRFPVVRGSHDDVLGFVHVRDLFVPPDVGRRAPRVGDLSREVALLPATKKVLPALSELRGRGQHIAVVVDEYGGTAGIVTLEDLIEELIGDIRDEYDPAGSEVERPGGEVEVDGLLNLDDFAEETGVALPDGPYETVGGYIMATVGRVPVDGDAVEAAGSRLSVTAVDGRRVARVRVTPLSTGPDVGPPLRGGPPADSAPAPPQGPLAEADPVTGSPSAGSVVVAGPGLGGDSS